MPAFPDIHLYHGPGTRSDRVKLLLDRLEFPYQMTLINQGAGEHKTPQYLRINPFGTLPGMTVDGSPIVESAAQMLFIADLDPAHRFAPRAHDPMRKHYLHWMVTMPASLEPMVMPAFSRVPRPGVKKAARHAIAIQTQLFQGPFCAGDMLTAADIFVHWGLRFLGPMGLLDDAPVWRNYVERLNAEFDWENLNHAAAASVLDR